MTTATRYRLAWLSARRRAQQQADAMDRLFGDQRPDLTLVLDETTEDVTWRETTPGPLADLKHARQLLDEEPHHAPS